MRRLIWTAAGAVVFVFSVGGFAATQQPPQPAPQPQTQAAPAKAQPDPLVEAARKIREERKNAPKATKVWTNDNIPTNGAAINVIGQASSTESGTSGSAAAKGTAGTSGLQKEEAYWRKQFAEARKKLEQDQSNLGLMQRELSQLQVQYYPDPTMALNQSVFRKDIQEKQSRIARMQQQVEQDKQAISNLEDELRRAGGDPGWARGE